VFFIIFNQIIIYNIIYNKKITIIYLLKHTCFLLKYKNFKILIKMSSKKLIIIAVLALITLSK